MNKNQFLNELQKTLEGNHITDIEDIMAEYEQHFEFKLADGYSEEEIAAKLGNPKVLANQFTPDVSKNTKAKGNKIITGIGLGFADIFVISLFIILFAWVIVMGATSIASATVGLCLISGANIYSLLPSMPYFSAFLFSIGMLALAVLATIGTIYCYLYFKQLVRAYLRWHKNSFAIASGNPVYPSLSMHPQLKGATYRRFRNIALISLTVLAAGFIVAYIVSSISAGRLEFWHAWHWFV